MPAKTANRKRMIANEQARIDKVQTIADEVLQSRQHEWAFLQNERDAVPELLQMGMLDAQKVSCLIALEQHAVCYCGKSGNMLHSIPRETLLTLAQKAKWNRKRALYWLDCVRSNVVDPNWLDTGPESLRHLIVADPVGYLVYCLGLIYAPAAIAKCVAGYLPITGFLHSQSQDDYFCGVDQMQAVSVETGVRLLNYRDRAIANAQLRALWNESEQNRQLVHLVNETARRAFGIMSPMDMYKLQAFQGRSISDFTQSTDALRQFHKTLLEVIAACIGRISHDQQIRNRPDYISHAEICDVANKLRGHSAFRMQGVDQINKLKSSKDFKAMLALRDFAVSALDATRKMPRHPVSTRPIVKSKDNPTKICNAATLLAKLSKKESDK